MGSKRRNADAFARLADGLAARGHPARTPDHVRSKVKELRQSYARARDAASRSGAAPVTCPFYRELRDILDSRHTSSPPATLDTSADEPEQALQPGSAPEVSPAPRGPPLEAIPGTSRQEEEEEEEGGSSSTDSSLQIFLLPSRSSSRASDPRGSPDRGSGPTGLEESASEALVVPETPPGPSLQGSPSAEEPPAPRRARRRTLRLLPAAATDPQLLAILRRQLEVSEQHLRLQEQALAWHREAWGALLDTVNRLVDYLAPHAVPAAPPPATPAPAAPPPAAPAIAGPSAVAPPPPREGHRAEGPLEPPETRRRRYLPVEPAPTQPRTRLQARRSSRPGTPTAGL
ncbi:uncharacterized protein LOC142002775 [Carettochelys insculpta]|uniref:uncharacterized protein LOC142002775 n=1 Tax=Carettochelys insculpta TaxID=44489 RepID=UPI003EBBC978